MTTPHKAPKWVRRAMGRADPEDVDISEEAIIEAGYRRSHTSFLPVDGAAAQPPSRVSKLKRFLGLGKPAQPAPVDVMDPAQYGRRMSTGARYKALYLLTSQAQKSASGAEAGVEIRTRADPPTLEPFPWTKLPYVSWVLVFISLTQMLMYAPFALCFKNSRRVFRGAYAHVRLVLAGTDPWMAGLQHLITISELAYMYPLSIYSPPSREKDRDMAPRRVRDEGLSAIFQEDVIIAVGDSDWWLTPTQMKVTKGYLRWLTTNSPDVEPNGPRFQRKEYMDLVRLVFEEQGLSTGYPYPYADPDSDQALIQFCTAELGAPLLTKSDDGGFMVDLDFMAGLDIRPGSTRYGGAVHLSPDLKRVTRVVCHGRTYKRGDPAYAGACYVWRSSLLTYLVAVYHVIHVHLLSSALVTTAVRAMDPDHPFRRLLAPFTIGSLNVAFGMSNVITAHGASLDRNVNLTHEALHSVLRGAAKTWDIKTLPEDLRKRGVDKLSAEAYPWGHFATKVHAAIDRFVTTYVDAFWATDEAVEKDAALQAFLADYRGLMPSAVANLPPERATTKAFLRKFANHVIWSVSVMHEHTAHVHDMFASFDIGSVYISGDNDLTDIVKLQPPKTIRFAVVFQQAFTSKHAPSLWQADPTHLHRFFPTELPLEVTKTYMDGLFKVHNELLAFKRDTPGFYPAPASMPLLDPMDVKISVTV